MLQEIFGGRLLGIDASFDDLDAAQLGKVAAIGAGFTGLLSLFNILGRFFWSALSDSLGRKTTYALFFLLGMLLYAAVPAVGRTGSVPLFCGVLCLILTMYGGGFAAIPAYLADLFGPRFVGAIHGRLLTAWSVAGVLGPVLVNYVNEQQVRAGVPRSAAYDRTMILLASLLAIGFVCNLLVKPVEVVSPEAIGPTATSSSPPASEATETVTRYADRGIGLLVGLWLIVALPLAWGLWTTLQQAWVLFG
jgi:MFS family permease